MVSLISLNDKQFELYTQALLKGLSELVAMYIAKNNITDIDAYLYPNTKQLENPLLMKDAKKAMEYFDKNYKDFLLVGDYDTDGVTASASFYLFVKEKYDYDLPVYIPERKEGYGVSKKSIDEAIKLGKKAIITVDNGIAAFEAIEYAKEKGLFVIVTDHHEIQKQGLPKADYLINPKRKDSLYSDKQISGAVVAWNCLKILDKDIAEKYLPLVLLGTIADVVPLVNQNRIISKIGTNLNIKEIEIPSIKEILKYFKKDRLEREFIEYKLSPMINSAGRMENAMKAYELFIETDKNEIIKKIKYLENTNEQRKEKQAEIEPYVMKQINKKNKFQLIFPNEINFPGPIVGIMAGKVKEETNQPSIVFYEKIIDGKKYYSGSGRSPDWFDFRELIEKLKERKIIKNGGGHKLAIGLTLEVNKTEEFILIFDEVIKNYKPKKEKIEVYQIFNLETNKNNNIQIIKNILNDLDLLEPFGNQNPIPKLAFKYKNGNYFKKIKDIHLKFNVGGISILSFFNKYNIKKEGIIIGLPQKNVWFDRTGNRIENYQILLNKYI